MAEYRKILFFSGSSENGGAENSLFDLTSRVSNSFTKNLWIAFPSSDGDFKSKVERDENFKTIVFEYPKEIRKSGRKSSSLQLLIGLLKLKAYSRPVADFISKNEIKCFYANGLKPFLIGCFCKKILYKQNYEIKLIWHLRDWIKGPTRLLYSLLGNMFADQIIANSNATLRQVLFVDNSSKSEMLYNPIDTNKYKPMSKSLAKELLGISQEGNHVAIFGMLAPWKGQEVFIRSASKVKMSNTKFYIIGDEIYETEGHGKEKERLLSLAQELNIEDNLNFLGYVKEPEKAYSAFDVVVHASTEPEPYGRVIAEAMSCAVPVIAANAGGAKEFKNDSDYPVFYTPGDSDKLANLIDELLNDEERESKAKSSRAWVEKNISFQALEGEMNKVIERAIAA
jgi:glycosyltransferase involved in cell wall biosynthesis